ncbi:NADPH-dependent FMN reductase [Kitasatospora arboriphila]
MTGPVRLAVLCGSAATPSSTERLLRRAAAHAESLGARVDFFAGERLRLPLYGTPGAASDSAVLDLVTSVAAADGLLVGSPCYHGSVSGLLKNAFDHLEELRDRSAPYLDGRAVGCLVVGQGAQGPANALRALRDIVHALRGWPTPLGVTVDGPRSAHRPTASWRSGWSSSRVRWSPSPRPAGPSPAASGATSQRCPARRDPRPAAEGRRGSPVTCAVDGPAPGPGGRPRPSSRGSRGVRPPLRRDGRLLVDDGPALGRGTGAAVRRPADHRIDAAKGEAARSSERGGHLPDRASASSRSSGCPPRKSTRLCGARSPRQRSRIPWASA